MDAKELRIGNLVKYKGNDVFLDISDFAELSHDENYFDVLFPIPITPERLERVGFENDELGKYSIDCGEYVMSISRNDFTGTLEKDSQWFVSIIIQYGNQPMTVVKMYIHEIQNLYFALTGKELEFKQS